MKKFFLVSSIIFICVMLMALDTNLFSQQVKKIQTIKKVDTAKLIVRFKTDLRVDVIHSSRCTNCDLPGIDAFYMGNILVDVSNHKAAGVGVATESILTVTYFDLMQGKMVTVTNYF